MEQRTFRMHIFFLPQNGVVPKYFNFIVTQI